MRVNVYAEEMTERIEIITKEIEGVRFTGLRFYLELPATFTETVENPESGYRSRQTRTVRGPFIHHPGDDDSAAVTFWGKSDLRVMLDQALRLLGEHYGQRAIAKTDGL